MSTSPAPFAVAAVLALAPVAVGWVLYPLWTYVRRGRALPVGHLVPGPVACVMATREPPAAVHARVADARACAAAADVAGHVRAVDLDVVVALDRDAPAPDADYRALLGAAARVVRAHDAPGKAAALNAGLRCARADIVVLTDSAQRFAPGAIDALARCFDQPGVGAASGRLCLPHDEKPGSVLGAYWRYELALRRGETRVYGLVAVTGAVYAIRRALWPPLPAGLICDDLYVPLHVARAGFRVVHCDAARAVDPRSFTREQDLARKVRTLTGMVQVCAWAPWVLVPWRNPVWVPFVCHKLLRLATPLLLLLAVPFGAVALALAGWLEPLARAAILGCGVPLILLDLVRPREARLLLDRLALTLRLLATPLVAIAKGVRGDWDVWAGPTAGAQRP